MTGGFIQEADVQLFEKCNNSMTVRLMLPHVLDAFRICHSVVISKTIYQ